MLARDLTALCGQIPPVLLSFGGCEVAALHLLSLTLAGVVLVDPDFGAVERRLAEGLLAVPVLLVTTSRERGEEEGRRRKDGEAREGTVHFDEALVDFLGAGPF